MSGLGWLFNATTLRFLAGGLATTVCIAAIAIVSSLAGGVVLALARRSPLPALRWPATAYIELLRALPTLLIILFAYFGLPALAGVRVTPLQAGCIAMSAYTSALVAELVRAGIAAVPIGICEAAQATGLGPWVRMRDVILPIAVRKMMPGLIAQFITLLKDTSLTAVIGVMELTRRGQIISAEPPFQPLPVYAVVGVTYFVCNALLAKLGRRLESRSS